MAHATALLLCAVMNALSDEPLHNSERSRAQRRLQKQPCTELQSMSPGVAPPRMAPGAQTRALEKFPRVWNATSRSGRIWKLEATKPWLEAGELMHGDHDPCLPRAEASDRGHGEGGVGGRSLC